MKCAAHCSGVRGAECEFVKAFLAFVAGGNCRMGKANNRVEIRERPLKKIHMRGYETLKVRKQ